MLNNDDRSIKISKANFEIRNKTRKNNLIIGTYFYKA